MRHATVSGLFVAVLLAGCTASAPSPPDGPPSTQGCTFATRGANDFFVLEPGWGLELEGDGERLLVTVTDETRTVDGVETRVLLEEEWVDGGLVEKSWNFVALCRETGDVFYFGEEVDDYEDGRLVAHSGEWLAGEDGAVPGILMPGAPTVGMRFYEEHDPGDAMDFGEIVAVDETVVTPAGTFTGALKVRESNPLEGSGSEYKWHAPHVGVIIDEDLRLVRYGHDLG